MDINADDVIGECFVPEQRMSNPDAFADRELRSIEASEFTNEGGSPPF
jgi:hypothetical protein